MDREREVQSVEEARPFQEQRQEGQGPHR
jgi:hypothetical protein